ncbi:MAG TPA: response regulator [bacterium]|nr:response regulator [bacterium]
MPTKTASDVYAELFTANTLFVAAAAAMLVWVSWHGYRLQPARFLRIWAGAWAAYFVARLVTLVQLSAFGHGLSTAAQVALSAVSQSGYYLHVMLLCACVLVLRRRGARWVTPRRLILYAAVLVALSVGIAVGTAHSEFFTRLRWRVSLRSVLSAMAFACSGLMMLRHGRRIRRFGASFFGAALLLGALHLSVHAWAFGVRAMYAVAALLTGLEILEVAAIGFGLLLWAQEDKNDQLEQTRHAALQAAKLTGQLLSLARNPASGVRAIDVGREAREVLPLLRSLAGARVSVDLATDDGPLRVRMKRGHVEQILINLVTNGRDAIRGDGAIELRIRRRERGESAAIELLACDTGVGMSDEVRQRVGELFFTTKPSSGSGMGMASVRSIVEETGGVIEFSPRPGGGTEVRVSWPEAQATADTEVEDLTASAVGAASATVLLVEDDAMVRGVAERELRAVGLDVLVAPAAAEAEALARGHAGRIDLLLSDVVMPEGSGPQLAARLRAERPEMAVCFMSGFVGEGDGGELPPGARILEKPFTPAELVAFVRGVLSDASTTQS